MIISDAKFVCPYVSYALWCAHGNRNCADEKCMCDK